MSHVFGVQFIIDEKLLETKKFNSLLNETKELTAIFIACGQDVACVSEASVGITRVDVTKNGDLYMSVSLPNLIVGTVGGGTRFPTQQECLKMIGCCGQGTARKFAEICTSLVLAGEMSIMAALAAGEFTQAHEKYARKKQNN